MEARGDKRYFTGELRALGDTHGRRAQLTTSSRLQTEFGAVRIDALGARRLARFPAELRSRLADWIRTPTRIERAVWGAGERVRVNDNSWSVGEEAGVGRGVGEGLQGG